MRYFFLLIILIHTKIYSQDAVYGLVKDGSNQNSVAYCSVSIKGTSKGTLTNEQGYFRLFALQNDTLVFSSIGFKTKTIPVNLVKSDSIIILNPADVSLEELTVKPNDNYLYTSLERCRKHLLRSLPQKSKAYFELETEKNDLPVEFIQTYNNSIVEEGRISSLDMKSGKVALAFSDSNDFFVSFDMAKAMGMFSLVNENKYLPYIPLQFKGNKLRKKYSLYLLPSEDGALHFSFVPKSDSTKYFKGEIWIDKHSNQLLSIKLDIQNATTFPFTSLSEDTLKNVNLSISKNYTTSSGEMKLSRVNLSYGFSYLRAKHNPLIYADKETYSVFSNGTIMLYDYGKPFILPYYEFIDGFSDYRKIAFLPFSESFWERGNGLVTTEQQEKNLEYFMQNGINFNFIGEHLQTENKKFFETNNVFWSEKVRVVLGSELPYDSIACSKVQQNFRSNLYHLDVQLLLMVNELDSDIECTSYTVFDVFKTFYNLPKEPSTNCFINIYFDICEIERRKMQSQLNTLNNKDSIDLIYTKTKNSLNELSAKYFKEVQIGKNIKELKKWNDYVKSNLGIDNFEIFKLEY